MAFKLDADAVLKLQQRLEEAVAVSDRDIPGTVVCIVNGQGQTLFSSAVGKIGSQSDEAMSVDGIFWWASCTKLIASIACMQLVERGVLKLDDPDQAETLCPALADVKVLEQDPNGQLRLVEKRTRITLRMLLSHTAGFGYMSYSPKLRDWMRKENSHALDFGQPLIAHPGEEWNYGFNIEWTSLLIERSTGMRASEYTQRYIFDPLGMKRTTMFPSLELQKHLVKMSHRSSDHTLHEGPHFMQSILDIQDEAGKSNAFQNLGGGCFGTASDYCQVLATILNNGSSPTTGRQILRPSTVEEMFVNQIPQFPNFARKGMPAAVPEETWPIPELYPAQPHENPQGWGLSFMLTMESTTQGRGPNSGNWAGMANCYWWVDRSNGVGGFIGCQIVPFADPRVMDLCSDVEQLVYSGRRYEPDT